MSNEHKKPDEQPLDPKVAHPDDVIVAPKGTNRARFIMTLLLVVMVLTTFTVSDQLFSACTGKGDVLSSYMSWNSPSGETRTLSGTEFMMEKRRLNAINDLLSQGRSQTSDDQVAMFLVQDDMAEHDGVRITDGDLRKTIEQIFRDSRTYKTTLEQSRMTKNDFEDTFRRMLRVQRHQSLLAASFALADPAGIEKSWKQSHQEYAFDYTEVPISSCLEEAKTQAPKGEELKLWFDALPEGEKLQFKTKDAFSAELAAFSLEGEFDGSTILAAYPRPADEDSEAMAKEYHQNFAYARFRRQPMEPGKSPFLDFDEVKDKALKEGAVYKSLMDWRADLEKRIAAGETVDLAAEATRLGLVYRKQTDPLTADGWRKLEVPWLGQYTIDAFMALTTDGALLPSIIVDQKGFVFGRLTKKDAARLPEFAEIEANVTDVWSKKKAKELCKAKVEALRDAFGTRPPASDATVEPFMPVVDAEKFKSVVEGAGFKLKRRDYQDRMAPFVPNPDEPGLTYLRTASTLYTLKEGTVPPAEFNRGEETHVFLVRVDAPRDPDIARMDPNDFQQTSTQLAEMQRRDFINNTYNSKDYLRERYGLHLKSWDDEKTSQN